MTIGLPSHIDLTVVSLDVSVPFYDKVLSRLGYHRIAMEPPNAPCWAIPGSGGNPGFGIALHPATREHRHDRRTPGLHHLALHADGRPEVDDFHRFLLEEAIEVLDPPAEYDYTPGYYAVFFADPDGLKLELVWEPKFDTGARSPA